MDKRRYKVYTWSFITIPKANPGLTKPQLHFRRNLPGELGRMLREQRTSGAVIIGVTAEETNGNSRGLNSNLLMAHSRSTFSA